MIDISITSDIRKIYLKYLESYHLLNWNQSLDDYMNESIKNYYLLKGSLYTIKNNNYEIGHFTIYDMQKENLFLSGMGMFTIPKLQGFSLGEVNNISKVIIDFISSYNIYGFCINKRLLDLYSLLGFENKELENKIYLVYKDKDIIDKIDLSVIF